MIKKILKLIVFVVASQILVFAQQADSIIVEKSLLWEISGNGLTESSYLFGTIHIIPKEDFFFTPSMEKAFNSAEKLIMEVDMDISLSAQLKLMQKMMLPEGESLSAYMTNREYVKLTGYLKDTLGISRMSLMAIDKLKPIFSYSVILEEKIKKAEVFEMHFMKRAKKRKMQLIGLETLEEQVGIIDNIPLEEQVSMLLQITESEDIMQEYQEMVSTYKKQDINKLVEFSKEDRELEKYTDELLVNRNQKWIAKLATEMANSACFIAVGSGHLAGKNGLIYLLRNEGFELRPVAVFENEGLPEKSSLQ